MKKLFLYIMIALVIIAAIIFFKDVPQKQTSSNTDTHFSFIHEVTLPGTPEFIYDTVTGDISPWWDHTFSDNPVKLYIDPKPGGGFWEIFDESGDGVKHATVIAADRGKLLRMDGPLGLAGHAVQLVSTYEFFPVGADSTRLKLTVSAAGAIQPEWPEVVENVWKHFIFGRLQPYVSGEL